ncbi:MAG: helix-turn-helix transcriptional regulator [Gammaproteobacteria bacterium]|jgi:transcriptional regulator EpsA
MSVQSSTSDLNVLLDTIRKSHFIRKHYDFYQWQQDYVCRFIPHDILIAAWGNFKTGQLQFDISSSMLDVRAHQLSKGCGEVAPLMSSLFRKWEDNNDRWFFNESFNDTTLSINSTPDQRIVQALDSMGSVLVYGFRDKRGENDVLYAFFNSSTHLETQTPVLSLIMPHLDAALRSVECLVEPTNSNNVVKLPKLDIISGRESQVLSLVVQGMTNVEIADTLFISLNTVKNHLKNIFRKMGVSSRAEAVAKYLVEFAPQTQQNIINFHRKKEMSVMSDTN